MKKFSPPTPQEVEQEAQRIGFQLNGEHFCSYYAMSDWKMKNGRKMSDWKAAVRYWKSLRDAKQQAAAPKAQSEDLRRKLLQAIDNQRASER